jgi:hypothetical protein
VRFKKLYGQEGYVLYSLNVEFVAFQVGAKIPVHHVVVVLVSENLKGYFFKLFFRGYGKNVGCGNQGNVF